MTSVLLHVTEHKTNAALTGDTFGMARVKKAKRAPKNFVMPIAFKRLHLPSILVL